MIVAIFGESCTGKSIIADALMGRLGAKVYSGKDYLRFDKNESAGEGEVQSVFKGMRGR